MRDKLLMLMMVPVLVLPLVVIAAGGDVELIWQELQALSQVPVVVTVYAQPSPGITPSPGVTPVGGVRAAPTLSRWGMISASIVLALLGLWALNEQMARDGRRR